MTEVGVSPDVSNAQRPCKASKGAKIAGWIIGGLPAVMMLGNGATMLFKPEFVVKSVKELGLSESVILPLGVVMLVAAITYLIPMTSGFGAILFTGYLGGAAAIHTFKQDPLHEVFAPIIFSVVLWIGLVLRDARMRVLLPFRKS